MKHWRVLEVALLSLIVMGTCSKSTPTDAVSVVKVPAAAGVVFADGVGVSLIPGRQEASTHQALMFPTKSALLEADRTAQGGRATTKVLRQRAHPIARQRPSMEADTEITDEESSVFTIRVLVTGVLSLAFFGGTVAGIISYCFFGHDPLPDEPLPPLHSRGGFAPFQDKEASKLPKFITLFPTGICSADEDHGAQDLVTRPM